MCAWVGLPYILRVRVLYPARFRGVTSLALPLAQGFSLSVTRLLRRHSCARGSVASPAPPPARRTSPTSTRSARHSTVLHVSTWEHGSTAAWERGCERDGAGHRSCVRTVEACDAAQCAGGSHGHSGVAPSSCLTPTLNHSPRIRRCATRGSRFDCSPVRSSRMVTATPAARGVLHRTRRPPWCTTIGALTPKPSVAGKGRSDHLLFVPQDQRVRGEEATFPRMGNVA